MTNRTGLEPDLFESPAFLLEIFERVFLIDAMSLEKAIQLDASQTEHLTQLYFGNAACSERFEGDALQSHARAVAAAGQMGSDSVWNVQGRFHKFTLTGLLPVVNRDSPESPFFCNPGIPDHVPCDFIFALILKRFFTKRPLPRHTPEHAHAMCQ